MNNQQNEPRRARTIAEYLEHVKEIKKQWSYPVLAFRGQKDKDWSLESTAERRVPNDRFIEYHQDLIKKCKLKNYDKREGKQLHELEILAALRHHGGAVCLMDFTRKALVALWFACENSKASGSVFLVNTADEKTFLEIAPTDIEHLIEEILQFKTRDDKYQKAASREQRNFTSPSQDKPKFWYWTPAHLNERITAQHSLFVFGLPIPNEPNSQKIIIESKNKDQIRQDLKEIHDIHEESLFPDFVGFAYTHRFDAPYESLNAEEYVRRGLKAQQQGDFDRAIQDYNEAIKLDPNFAKAYNNRGNAYFNKGEIDRAIEGYNEAIKLKPNFAAAYNNRGATYFKKGDFDRAIEDYNEAIKLKPNFAAAYNSRGNAYVIKGDFDQAIEDYSKAIGLKPNDAAAYSNRGFAYLNKGNFDQAIEGYNEAIKLKPSFAEAYYNRGNAYDKKGELDQAIEDYNKAIELKPSFAEAYYSRGITWLHLSEWEKARADLTTAKNMGLDVAAMFALLYGSVADFERKCKIRLPEDIASMLTEGRDRG